VDDAPPLDLLLRLDEGPLRGLGVLFLDLEEEVGVVRGAVFRGTTFNSLYRVVGDSGTCGA